MIKDRRVVVLLVVIEHIFQMYIVTIYVVKEMNHADVNGFLKHYILISISNEQYKFNIFYSQESSKENRLSLCVHGVKYELN